MGVPFARVAVRKVTAKCNVPERSVVTLAIKPPTRPNSNSERLSPKSLCSTRDLG